MITVRLTVSAYAKVTNLVGQGTPLADALRAHAVVDKQRIDVTAPYVAWHRLAGLLRPIIFGPSGGHRKSAVGYIPALRNITRAINHVDHHPALMGLGMMGWQTDIIYAWEQPRDGWGNIYSPVPVDAGRFVVLYPDWQTAQDSLRITRWHDTPSRDDPAAQEHFHLAIWRSPVP